MKKITIIEIVVALLILIALGVYFLPVFLNNKEEKTVSQIKASNAIFISKTIEEFARNKNILPSEASKIVADELNKTEKNPYDNKKPLFSFSKDIPATTNIEPDDNLKMVVMTTLDDKGALVGRIVISPPSYVSYYKEKDEK